MSNLVTIGEIPPLHQSTEAMLACHLNYKTQVIDGRRKRGGLESMRGLEIHHVHALYQAHCAKRKVSMDLEAFDRLSKGAGSQAHKILVGVRDNYQVDYAHLLVTEPQMSLDEAFRPTLVSKVFKKVVSSPQPSAYAGTPDAIYTFPKEAMIYVPDWKSHPSPFEPDDTLQAKMYALFCFMHFEWCNIVKFELVFVRFRNVRRAVTFNRQDLPRIIDTVRAARARQLSIHERYASGQALDVLPSPNCHYCPLLANGCPIEDKDDVTTTPQDDLRYLLFHRELAAKVTKRLRDYVQATGNAITVRDGNNHCYKYGPVESQSKVFPIFERDAHTGGILYHPDGRPALPIIEQLTDYAYSDPGDVEWLLKLVIASTKMKAALSANKRVVLDQSLKDNVFAVTKTSMKITQPAQMEPEEEEVYDDDQEED